MTAYYNEFNPYAAQWLRNLIKAGHIAPGYVDERSIEDVTPNDIAGFTQCHFFAGIGVWSFALRRAGWDDTRPVWTGSCPCQPFSAAGKGLGFADERHLWPAFLHLISQCGPAIVLGEQVASSAVDDWIDLVHADLEALGYAFGSVPYPSAGLGAPHIRDRNYWMATRGNRRPVVSGRNVQELAHAEGIGPTRIGRRAADQSTGGTTERGETGRLANATEFGREWGRPGETSHGRNAPRQQPERLRDAGGLADRDQFGQSAPAIARIHDAEYHAQPCGDPIGLADDLLQQRPDGQPGVGLVDAAPGRNESAAALAGLRGDMRPGPTNGFWRDADWLYCRDGKWRPVEPGTFPLVDGPPARVGRSGADWRTASGKEGFAHRAERLRGYGNAINAEAARVFIEAVMGCQP